MNNMARVEDIQRHYQIEEARKAKHQSRAVDAFGQELGMAYFQYAEDLESEDGTSPLDAFAEAVVTATESGSHEDKVAALKAVLRAFDFKLNSIAGVAYRASSRSVRY